MSVLPPGWKMARIGDLIELSPKNTCSDETDAGFVPLQRLGTTFRAEHSFETKKWREIKKGYTHFANGDVLLARITPSFENGKAGIARNLPNGVGAGSTEYFVCRPRSGVILPEYLLAFFMTQEFLRNGEQVMSGAVGQQRVPKQYVLDTQIPLAPLPEQKRIADKLDRLLAAVDTCKVRLDAIPAILKRFRQSVLTAATSGELTEGEAEDSSRTSRPTTLESLCVAVVDCPHSTPQWTTSGRVCLRTTNFNSRGLNLEEVRFVSDAEFEKRIARLRPREGDIVYSREGGILGIACLIPARLEPCLGQRMMLLRVREDLVRPAFLCHALNSESVLQQVRRLIAGSASPHLNLRDIRKFRVTVPSLKEQDKVIDLVDTLFERATAIEASIQFSLKNLESLARRCLARAFSGHLSQVSGVDAEKSGPIRAAV